MAVCVRVQLQHLAAACIQRNIRKLMRIQEWPWWRLYTKVKPLLNVQRTEEELRDKEVYIHSNTPHVVVSVSVV